MTLIVNKPPDKLVWPEDYLNQIVCGDALTVLKTMLDGVIQTCICSPPYWGLRDYGVAGQIGLEPTPEEYTAKMVEVFREVRRVLKDDGTLWLNLGDSYAGGGRAGKDGRAYGGLEAQNRCNTQVKWGPPTGSIVGLKPKDLVGIPWLVAFALRADGWYLRSDIIWSKPNPMPESVIDRPTKAHEYLFLMSKNQKYYYDANAIRGPLADCSVERSKYGWYGRTDPTGYRAEPDLTDEMGERFAPTSGRNKRSVWEVSTQPFPQAHFATFPEKLIEPCILAGSREGDIVLDPFFGSGTVGKRSKELGRKWTGIELNPDYCKIAEDRLRQEELF